MLHSASGDKITATQLYSVLTLRSAVFIIEQECLYQDLDGRDLLPSTAHLWWQPDDEPHGYLRLLRDPDGARRIGRVCTTKQTRGTGLGVLLMKAAMERVGGDAAVLEAQTYAQSFYARFGFEPTGTPYVEDGIEHVTMRHPAA